MRVIARSRFRAHAIRFYTSAHQTFQFVRSVCNAYQSKSAESLGFCVDSGYWYRYRDYMLHVHVATSARPDRVMATGVVNPYPVSSYPPEVALQTVESFTRDVRPNNATLEGAPGGRNLMQPEEIAMLAQRVAVASANGYKFPRSLDPRVAEAANYLLAGKSFVIRSAGRAALIQPPGPIR